MPDREKLTLPPLPPITPQEEHAQHVLWGVYVVLNLLKSILDVVHAYVPEPPDAKDMEDLATPESVSYAIRGDIEVILADQVGPALQTLQRAIHETPESLRCFWEASKGGSR